MVQPMLDRDGLEALGMRRAPALQGHLSFPMKEYGKSVLGAPLLYLPASEQCRLLVFAGLHGEEAEGVFLLSRALRLLANAPRYTSVILCTNPDGVQLGTRGNARGVDLNRNWNTSNWSAASVYCRLVLEAERITELSPGVQAESEPETQALRQLVEQSGTQNILSLHAPLACIDAPHSSPLTEFLVNATGHPWQRDIGYPTPGSFGTWCHEKGLHAVTWELPREAPEILAMRYAETLASLLENPLEAS